jgi:hypothetical protein
VDVLAEIDNAHPAGGERLEHTVVADDRARDDSVARRLGPGATRLVRVLVAVAALLAARLVLSLLACARLVLSLSRQDRAVDDARREGTPGSTVRVHDGLP